MKLLIPGGAGYIGSHMVRYAQEKNHEVTVLDNFSTGHEWAINDCEILRVDLLNQEELAHLLKGRFFDGVIHFAAKSLVGESVVNPSFYYFNNVVGTLNLVKELFANDINNMVFSSTAAIYGNPLEKKIDENHPKNPINPYGRTKLMVENILQDFCSAYGFNVTSLRYFNAAGAHESSEIGELHEPETHLIPNILNSVLLNNEGLKIFGNNYNTNDGTCVRDYVHVTDLAQAHLLALEKMEIIKGYNAFNLGNGDGFSVLEIINSCELVTNLPIEYSIVKRRIGDPDILVANPSMAEKSLCWKPHFSDINQIILSAWNWHRKLK